MIEFTNEKPTIKISGRKASFSGKGGPKNISKKFDELDSALTPPKKKILKKEKIAAPAQKTKQKDYNVDYYVKDILSRYEAELHKDPDDLKRAFGAIVDWGMVDVDEIVGKLILVLEQLCNIVLFPYQKIFAARVFQSVLLNDGEELTALWARQSGKSEVVTDTVASLMVMLPILSRYFPQLNQFKDGVYVGVFAPTEPQAKTIGERFKLRIGNQMASEFLRDPEVDIAVEDLWMSNGSYVRIHSAAPQAKVESKTYHIIIIDEAQDVSDDKILKSIHPMGSSTSATIIKLGTPHQKNCEFLEAIKRNKRMFQLSKGKVKNHFEFDYKVVCRYNERYSRFVEKEKSRYGEDSDYFRMSYKLEWLLDKGMAVTVDIFEAQMRVPSLKIEVDPDNTYMYVAGLDLGKKYDSTVLTIVKLIRRSSPPRFHGEDAIFGEDDLEIFKEADLYYKQIANWYEWEGDNWESQMDDIIRVLTRYENMQLVSVDSTGVGDPIHEILSRRLSYKDIQVRPVYFSLKNQHNLAQLFYKNINHSNIQIPGHPSSKKTKKFNKFMIQMLDAEKFWRNDKMVIRHGSYKGAKDDFVQSLFLALDAAEESLGIGNVTETANVFIESRSKVNMDDVKFVDGILETIDISEVQGFENVRKLAREGRLVVRKASFSRPS